MSRLTWNDCCCGPLAGISGDMVLVRSGWYHFLVMTVDGRINCFVGSGLAGAKEEKYGGVTLDTRRFQFLNNDWARVNKSVWFSNHYSPNSTFVIDPLGLSAYGSWDSRSEWKTDVQIYVPGESVRAFNTPTSSGFGRNFNCSGNIPGVIGDSTCADCLFNTDTGECRNGGCWYGRNRILAHQGDENFASYLPEIYWPHGYMDFDGSGCTIGRPYTIDGVTSERWKYLITEKYGIFGDFGSVNFNNYSNGVTGITMVEEYKSPAKPAPVGHPLRVPTLPTTGSGDDIRPLRVIDIECGAYHNVIRLEDNTIMCWGLNSMGQCNVPESLQHGSSAPHPKLNKVLSIHAGFSTTAVVFNDGTALCWGDPEVACAVNNWTDIKVSPIKRNSGVGIGDKSCIGAGSEGFPDLNNPIYAANKYDNPTYNANTDWFKYWRSGTPGYPEFDLGVEVNPIWPVNWLVTYDTPFLNGGAISDPIYRGVDECNVYDPKSWCQDCAGMTIGKDFAVGMRRTGQIITTRKNNAPAAGQNLLYSRDCSTDKVTEKNDGFFKPLDGGLNYKENTYCCCNCAENARGIDQNGQRFDFLPSTVNPNLSCYSQFGSYYQTQGQYRTWCDYDLDAMPRSCRNEVARAAGCGDDVENCAATTPKCNTIFCSAYQRNVLPNSWTNTWVTGQGALSPECISDDRKTLFNLPEGIGCYNTNVLEPGYDPNWAISGSIGNIYTAGRQVTNSTFGSVYPSWNVNKVGGGGNGPGSNYGWSTLPANTGRYKPGTRTSSGAPIPGLQSYCGDNAATPDHCQIHFGQIDKCEWFCPSNVGGFYSTAMGDLQNNAKGVPGLFRYPEHLVNSLTCVAGTNTVGWVSSSKLLKGEQLVESLDPTFITPSSQSKCEQYHLNDYVGANSDTPPGGGPPVPLQAQCFECGNLGSNPDKHIYEVGDTTYAGIYTNTTDKDGNNNPFRDGINTNWCTTRVNITNPSFMLPSKPWGPFNISTNVGYGNPPIEDYGICGRKTQSLSVAAYVNYISGSYQHFIMQSSVEDGTVNVPWRNFLGPGLPRWFFTSCYRVGDESDFTGALSVNGTLYGFLAPNAISFWQLYDVSGTNIGNDEDNPRSDVTYYYDCYLSQKTTACSPKGTSYLWKAPVAKNPLAHCESSTKWAVDLLPDRTSAGYPGELPPSPLSGQQGFTCDCGIDDRTNRWCFNNPIISYATGRSYSVSLRACPWSRGLSGEFIWKDSCQENSDYVNKIGNDGWTNSTSVQVKKTNYIKLWVSGILEDPCPPWPVDVNLNGITCGVYPKWVPVPSTNTNRRADKGQWTGVSGTVTSCLATAAWCYTAAGHTCGCTAAGCVGCETSWPSGVTGCTLVNNCATVMDFGDLEPPGR